MDRESAKGLKWPAEDLQYTWGSNKAVCTPKFLLGQNELQTAEVCMVAWCLGRYWVQFLLAMVLASTLPREV